MPHSGSYNMLAMYPLLIYSVLSWTLGATFNKIAFYSSENTSSNDDVRKDVDLTWALFSFHFFNNNCGLLYATFYLRDLTIVQSLSACVVIVTTLFDYLMYEVYVEKWTDTRTDVSNILELKGKSFLPSISDSMADEKWKSLVLDELKRQHFHPQLQHLRLTTRYSFCCMFVVAFPITPLIMWLYNGMDPNLYLQKLKSSVRVPVIDTSSLTEWLDCFKFINLVAVIVNSFLFCILTSDMSIIIPIKYLSLLDSDTNRYKSNTLALLKSYVISSFRRLFYRFLLMIILEHVVVAIEVLLSYLFEMVPQGVQLKVAKERMESFNTLIQERLAMYQFIGKSVLADRAKENAERQLSANTLESKYSSQFGYNPYLLLGVVVSPFLCISLGISQFVFIPICILYFSYLKKSKDRHDIMAAAGVISDVNVSEVIFMNEFMYFCYTAFVLYT